MCHRLYSSKQSRCFVPHGHNEYVKVYLSQPKGTELDGGQNMMAPFETLKKKWHSWIDDHVDHCLQISDQDPMLSYFRENEPENVAHLLITPGDPTTEVLAALFMAKINAFMATEDHKVICHRLEIEETPTNTVIFTGDPDKVINTDGYAAADNPWWKRPDMTINDMEAS